MRVFVNLPVVVTLAALGALAMGASVVTTACATAQPVDTKGFADVKAQSGSFVTGTPRGLGVPEVVNRRDFIYALAFGGDDVIAFVHHVSTSMELTASQFEPLRPRFQQPVNSSEFDVEDVVVVDSGPGKGAIAVPSRQGIARAFDAKTGAPLRDYTAGVALIRAALSPDGSVLAFGAADGRVIFVDPATFALRGQTRLHDGEVRGLAFLPDGRLLSTSFDGTLKVSALQKAEDPAVHLVATNLKTGERAFLAHLDGKRAIATVRDTRQPNNAISTAAVKRLGLNPTADGTPLGVVTGAGPGEGPAVDLGHVVISTLDLGALAAAVCDACVPPGAELVLGGTATARAQVVDDIARGEIIVKPTDAEGHAVMIDGAVALVEQKAITLPGPGTDIDVAARAPGHPAVVVSFSHEKAIRSFDLYDLEKKGVYPAPSPKSGAALVDLEQGTLGKTFIGHKGFTVTTAISPDGRTVVTGGWDKRVLVWDAQTGERVTEREVAWLVRRVRFAPDGHLLGVAAWTPVNALNEGNSDPALLLYPLSLENEKVATKQ